MKNKKENTKDIIIKNQYELTTLNHNERLSFTFDKINLDSIHFKDVNFNLFESKLLKKLQFEKILLLGSLTAKYTFEKLKNEKNSLYLFVSIHGTEESD